MSNLGKRSAPSEFIDLTNSDSEDEKRRSRAQHSKQPRLSSGNRSTSSGRPSWASGSSRQTSSRRQSQTQSQSQAVTGCDQRGEGDEDEVVDLSQDVEEGFGWVCLGALDGKVVGVRYYAGYATPGEQIMIRREPGNPYDSNAIRINNVQGTQIGHLPRDLSSKLAGFLVCVSRISRWWDNGY